MLSRRLVLALLAAAACDNTGTIDFNPGPADAASQPDAPTPDAPPPDASPLDPATLEQTGLYSDFAARTLAPGIVEYTVNHELWADGATKRRFVFLPGVIDTTDMNFWSLPEGTKLWKEFTSGDTIVETRLLWKQGPTDDDWYTMSYAWNEAGDQALAAPDGAEDAIGTQHDIPRATDCGTCHERQPGFALGFSALQLDHGEGGLNLGTLVSQNRLSEPPPGKAPPFFPLPGNDVDQAALGYLHGNCGPCHNPNSDVFADTTQIRWHLEVETLATVGDTTIFESTVGVAPLLPLTGATSVIEPGNRDASAAFLRMSQRDPTGDSNIPMPPLATEVPDTEGGVAAVGAWIDSLEE